MMKTKEENKILKTQHLHKARKETSQPTLHLSTNLEAEEPARELLELAKRCQKMGWHTMVASEGGTLVQESERAGVRHLFLKHGEYLFVKWQNRIKLKSILQKNSPRLIHAHGWNSLALVYRACRTFKIPVVVDIVEPDEANSLRKNLTKMILQHPSLFRVPTQFMGKFLQHEYGIPAHRIYHIPSAVDYNEFDVSAIKSERITALARSWRLPEQGAILLVPLPLQKGMGHDLTLKAVAKLADQNLTVVFVGHDRQEPGQREILEGLVKEYNLDGKVLMPEFCSDWPAALWHASLVLLPNSREVGCSRILLAAQAMGRPIIVFDHEATREWIDPETAVVVSRDNQDELVDALHAALSLTQKQRAENTKCARRFVTTKFSREHWLEDYLALYKGLLQQSADNKSANH